MDYKRTTVPMTTKTRNTNEISEKTGNIYESVIICSKRADQINAEIRQELYEKLEEFASFADNLEEIHENREQTEVSKYYEKLPKPSLIALEEFLENKTYFKRAYTEENVK